MGSGAGSTPRVYIFEDSDSGTDLFEKIKKYLGMVKGRKNAEYQVVIGGPVIG